MRFRVLGPLEVVHDGRPLPLGGAKQRATLGLLLLRANRVVATGDLLRALWPGADGPPPTARKILQNAIRGLRVLLSDDTVLTQPPGYRLRTDRSHVDVFEFYRRAEEGRAELAASAPETAAATLRAALALWRGPALADLTEAGVAWPELTALRNARLDVLEDYFEAELAIGRQHAVLGELEVTVEAEPLRERLCHQLMLALYRSGRQAEALRVYARVRAELVERVGLEPGLGLQALQRAILAHDQSLNLPTITPPAARELKVLDGLLEYVRLGSVPHLVTVLGPPGAMLTRFVAGFEGLVAGHADQVRLRQLSADGRGVRAEILASLRGITADRPLVLTIANLHRAEDRVLDFVEDLAESAGPVPLLVVATAWPELLDRRPEWSGGKPHATTLTLGSRANRRKETRRVPLLVAAS